MEDFGPTAALPNTENRRSQTPSRVTSTEPQGESEERTVTGKRKRNKYVGKACAPCKARKIRCGGGFPCASCVRRKNNCASVESVLANDLEENSIHSREHEPRDYEATRALRDRMASLESHLEKLSRAILLITPASASNISNASQSSDDSYSQASITEENIPNKRKRVSGSRSTAGASPRDSLSFAKNKNSAAKRTSGETSVTHALQRVEDRLNELGLPIDERTSAPETPPMTPLPSNQPKEDHGMFRQSIREVLEQHHVKLSRKDWNDYVETYLIEVHPLYPFFEEEVVKQKCEELWATMSSVESEDVLLDHKIQSLLVLAIGRCSLSSRIQRTDGIHSAGWSLYCSALELQGSLLDLVTDDSNPLSSLHTLALVVIYLIRLDATERAQKILSLAIMHAHHLGIHLRRTHEEMTHSESELFKRAWWCLYVLDRRVAFSLGRPFLIQDSNVCFELTASIDPEVPEKRSDLDFYQIDPEPSQYSHLHYLNVMVRYSRVVGKVWESFFGTEASKQAMQSHVYEYLESLIHEWMESVPKFLICNHENIHDNGTSYTLFKQQFLIQLRKLHLLMIIRSPMRRCQNTAVNSTNVESNTICLHQARFIINMFAQCSLKDGVYGFPFLPYLLEATITMLACLTRLPSLRTNYRDTAQKAVKMLNQFYKKTWVSGKMARMIFKLGDILTQVLSAHSGSGPRPSEVGSMQATSGRSIPRKPAQETGFTSQRISDKSRQQVLQNDPASLPDFTFHNSESTQVVNRSTLDSSSQYEPSIHQPGALIYEANSAEADMQTSMIADFPFELDFGNLASQAVGPGNNQGLQTEIEDFSTPFFGVYNMEWAEEFLSRASSS
ncbi:fungal specific transcription factor domain-containing protein [Phlyctema vagabunda]|uniref:Fungal specific transcription factor domain-containing protein n=1 Tax=Phlyctema vagabunda TaxID=108571 RepID=A0ABR4P4E7_9HELO